MIVIITFPWAIKYWPPARCYMCRNSPVIALFYGYNSNVDYVVLSYLLIVIAGFDGYMSLFVMAI